MLDGECDIFVMPKGNCCDVLEDELGKKVATVIGGGFFGELALMYDKPRAATVIATTDIKVATIDELTFKSVLIKGNREKRDRHKKFLQGIDLLSSLDSYQLMRIADALDVLTFDSGSSIILEGESGDRFYIIEEGTVRVEKLINGSAQVVATLGKGNYFGELALLYDQVRAASVVVESKNVSCISLSRERFTELLGPVEHVLRMREKHYKEVNENV